MPRKKTGNRKTPEPLVALASDGLHYVRPASVKDQHPMRFVLDQFRVEGLPNNKALPRHVETAERGVELMTHYTDKACKENPELKKALKRAGNVEPQPQRHRKKASPKLMQFPITRFACVRANSVAQIWVCTKEPWEGVPMGRKAKGGRPPAADKLPHRKGEFAVLKGDEPVMDTATSQPKVFALLMQAEAAMQREFENTPGENRMADNNDPEHPTTTVYQNMTFSVHFDPDNNGPLQPFNIYNHQVHRPVLHSRGDYPLKFRSIVGAVKEADRLDKLSRGAL